MLARNLFSDVVRGPYLANPAMSFGSFSLSLYNIYTVIVLSIHVYIYTHIHLRMFHSSLEAPWKRTHTLRQVFVFFQTRSVGFERIDRLKS